jgi:hypothetical protein
VKLCIYDTSLRVAIHRRDSEDGGDITNFPG